MLPNLTYELSILAKAIQHKNLSAASAHIGLSQPQLSRLISKIEHELNIILLDRTARRKSGWTPLAQNLAVVFSKGMGRLESEIRAVAEEIEINELHIATLEGLSTIASNFVKKCFDQLKMKSVYLDVLDFKDLDAQFLGGNLDLIFTVRAPSKQKYSHIIEVGYQQMERVYSDKKTLVISPFELAGAEQKIEHKSMEEYSNILVSNSLAVRQNWLKNIGGNGALPVDAKTGKGKGQYTIYLIGSELISPKVWSQIKQILT